MSQPSQTRLPPPVSGSEQVPRQQLVTSKELTVVVEQTSPAVQAIPANS